MVYKTFVFFVSKELLLMGLVLLSGCGELHSGSKGLQLLAPWARMSQSSTIGVGVPCGESHFKCPSGGPMLGVLLIVLQNKLK
jgi:hypothetical protein